MGLFVNQHHSWSRGFPLEDSFLTSGSAPSAEALLQQQMFFHKAEAFPTLPLLSSHPCHPPGSELSSQIFRSWGLIHSLTDLQTEAKASSWMVAKLGPGWGVHTSHRRVASQSPSLRQPVGQLWLQEITLCQHGADKCHGQNLVKLISKEQIQEGTLF